MLTANRGGDAPAQIAFLQQIPTESLNTLTVSSHDAGWLSFQSFYCKVFSTWTAVFPRFIATTLDITTYRQTFRQFVAKQRLCASLAGTLKLYFTSYSPPHGLPPLLIPAP